MPVGQISKLQCSSNQTDDRKQNNSGVSQEDRLQSSKCHDNRVSRLRFNCCCLTIVEYTMSCWTTASMSMGNFGMLLQAPSIYN